MNVNHGLHGRGASAWALAVSHHDALYAFADPPEDAPMHAELKPVIEAVLDRYSLPIDGDHGIAHWARVLENGLRLAEETGADRGVVSLFAVLHDSRRFNEGYDPDHGARGAALAKRLRGKRFELDDGSFQLLIAACAGHTHEMTHPDVTVQTCWDADRLDLGRVGIEPHPSRLCTEIARRPEMIRWAHGRASFRMVPEFILHDWGVDLSAERPDEDA